MSTWQEKISRCFGLEDRHFAGHPSDEQEAFELLAQLRNENIGWAEFRKELANQLATMPKLNATNEINRVRKYFKVWMLD